MPFLWAILLIPNYGYPPKMGSFLSTDLLKFIAIRPFFPIFHFILNHQTFLLPILNCELCCSLLRHFSFKNGFLDVIFQYKTGYFIQSPSSIYINYIISHIYLFYSNFPFNFVKIWQ
jgi:hypothetical protein